jgi:uncharacterized protein (TIGR03437 family)
MVCIRKMHVVAIAAAATFCLAASEKLVAASPDTSPNITYAASGTFATPQLSGADVFKLAGEPFSIKLVVNSATPPTTHGATWAKYTGLPMTGMISTGLEPTPYTIESNKTSIELSTGNPAYDLFTMFAPVSVVDTPIYVTATIQMPPGTISKPLVHPFAAITLGPCTEPVPPGPCVDTVVYQDPSTGASTTLGIASGTLAATIPGGGPDAMEAPASVQLHAGGAQVITAHADGTKTVRPIGAAPVDLGDSSDRVALQFYASGVRDGSAIHVQIAGHDVPVLYTGPAGHFAGLDEVSVRVPRSLAGSGNVDVELTVDGRTASPVHIQIQ